MPFSFTVESSASASPLGAQSQGELQNEILDLRSSGAVLAAATGTRLLGVQAQSEARFLNSYGFYEIQDNQGTIQVSVGETLQTLKPGDANYAQEALKLAQKIPFDFNGQQIILPVEDGKLYAPFLVSNGTIADLLQTNPQNASPAQEGQPVAFFAFLEANPDQLDHIRLLADNSFAFEDQINGGDHDYDDLIVKVYAEPQANVELIDLRAYSGQVAVTFTEITSDASFSNSVRYYPVEDQLGKLTVSGNPLFPGDPGYETAAKANAVAGRIDKTAVSQTLLFQGGNLYAPYLEVVESPEVSRTYFSYIRGNGDRSDHMLFQTSNNLFRVEDTQFGGDIDFNDLSFKFTLPQNPVVL